MKRYDPRRADSRSLPDKLVDMILALSNEDLNLAQSRLDQMAMGRPKSRAANTQLPIKKVAA